MSQENFTDSDDLTQIGEKQRSSLQLLEQLAIANPELADDLAEIHDRTRKTLVDLEEIGERERKQNDDVSAEN